MSLEIESNCQELDFNHCKTKVERLLDVQFKLCSPEKLNLKLDRD